METFSASLLSKICFVLVSVSPVRFNELKYERTSISNPYAPGAGAQFLCVSVGILLLALVGMFYPGSRGSLYTAAILLYALTSGITVLAITTECVLLIVVYK